MSEPSVNLAEVALRLKEARKARGMTLDDVAQGSGFAKSWLSKVENYRITPNLTSLVKLCKALQLPMERLFEGIGEHELEVVSKANRKIVDRDDGPDNPSVYEALAHLSPQRQIEPLVLHLPPKGARKEALSHDGDEFLLILVGEATLEFGEEHRKLEEGDSAYFNGTVPHRLVNHTDRPIQALCVFCGPPNGS